MPKVTIAIFHIKGQIGERTAHSFHCVVNPVATAGEKWIKKLVVAEDMPEEYVRDLKINSKKHDLRAGQIYYSQKGDLATRQENLDSEHPANQIAPGLALYYDSKIRSYLREQEGAKRFRMPKGE